jgi:hypothetical protein
VGAFLSFSEHDQSGVLLKIHDACCDMIPTGNHNFFQFDEAHQPILRDYDSNCLRHGIAKTKHRPVPYTEAPAVRRLSLKPLYI